MKNSENKKFEESWKNVFLDAEATPPDAVWTNIDLHLSRTESGDMKRRVVFYQRLAAASVIFAIALTGLGIWYSTTGNPGQIATSDSITNEKGLERKEKGIAGTLRSKDESVTDENSEKDRDADAVVNENKKFDNPQASSRVMKRSGQIQVNKKGNKSTADQGVNVPPSTYHEDKQQVVAATRDASPGEILVTEENKSELRKENGGIAFTEVAPKDATMNDERESEIPSFLPSIEPVASQAKAKKKTNTNEDWWASLGGATGSYNPNAGTTAGPLYSNNAVSNSISAAQQGKHSDVGTSISFGMNFGKKIASRVMVMTGFTYLTQSTEYNSNVAMVNTNNSAAFAADALSQALTAPTTGYTISNVSEFVSIPLQAGYLFIDRNVGLQLNAGIASDFFVKNTLSDQSGKLLRYTQGAGDHSSYRTVNWTGLVGTELSYKVAEHYRVSVVPGLRYSFNSVLKPTTGATLNPMVWDVGFRFRYMF